MSSPARLLVVDDNADNRDMLARRLRKRGYEVHTAPDGGEALRMVDDAHYDLVVLDIMMPGIDGIEVLRRLRATYAQAELPILMATAKSDSKDVVDALSLGANDYVTKPIDFPVVLARIQSHLQTRHEAASVPAPAAVLPPDGRATAGTVLDGRYEVVREIGEGGFAIVFEALQLSTGQSVAIKVLRHHRAVDDSGSGEKRRFEREMKVIGKLAHPNVVRLIDFGELKARVERLEGWAESTETGAAVAVEDTSASRRILKRLPYIVMELIDGEPLGSIFDRKAPLSVELTTAIMVPVVSAVAAAHRLGVVHRDLKPPNILVARTVFGGPDPKVLDFGIAKPAEDDSSQSNSFDLGIIGTPEYMAPEQAQGQTRGDERSDQYSIGVMLYQALTGRRPFEAESFVQLLHMVGRGDFPPPRVHRPELSVGLEAVVLRAMATKPEDRYPNLDELGRDLVQHAPEQLRSVWEPAFTGAFEPPPAPTEPPVVRLSAASSPSVRVTPSVGVASSPPLQKPLPPPARTPSPALLAGVVDESAISRPRAVGVALRDSSADASTRVENASPVAATPEPKPAPAPPSPQLPPAGPDIRSIAWKVALFGVVLAIAGAVALALK